MRSLSLSHGGKELKRNECKDMLKNILEHCNTISDWDQMKLRTEGGVTCCLEWS